MIQYTPENSEDGKLLVVAAQRITFAVAFVNEETKKADEEAESERKLLAHIEMLIHQEVKNQICLIS